MTIPSFYRSIRSCFSHQERTVCRASLRRLLVEQLEDRRLLTVIDLATLSPLQGTTLFGADAYDISGVSVSSAGDINGDGFDDLLIGAHQADASGNAKPLAGESYVIFGGNSFTNSILPTHLGTSAADMIMGTVGAEILNGADGDDTLVGGGGADVLLGGRGDDILAVSDLTFRRIVGGAGFDTLRLDGSGHHLNLTTISDNRIVDIEQIDITGSGNNTLTLNQREVLNLSSHSNTLMVRRNAGDVVNIGSGWTQQANEVIGPDTFEVFTQGAAILKIQLAAATSAIVNQFVNHIGYSGLGSSIDTGKVLAKEGAAPTLLTYDNLINTSRGINGMVFDIQNLPGTVTSADFVFQMSPTGAFDLGAHPVGGWTSAPVPSTVTVIPGSPARVSIAWPDNAIANRWLRVSVKANANTGLAAPEVYYIGHLLGETTGPSGSVFTVAFADITPIRGAVGSTVNASSIHDIDKNGTVAFADISAMRSNVGAQLTIITIPGAGGGGGMASSPAGDGREAGRGTISAGTWFASSAPPIAGVFDAWQPSVITSLSGSSRTDHGSGMVQSETQGLINLSEPYRVLSQRATDPWLQNRGMPMNSSNAARDLFFGSIETWAGIAQRPTVGSGRLSDTMNSELDSIIEHLAQ
jgi:hypothetical protein